MASEGEDSPSKACSAIRWDQVAAQLAVALPEIGWAVTESSAMPLLLKFKVHPALLSAYWLCSPIFGVFLHPVLGHLSDKYGRRPFILLLGGMASVGSILLPPLVAVCSGNIAIVLVLVVLGMLDACHDLLLTPTRAAMNDVFEPESSCRRCVIAGGVAKILALMCVVSFGGEWAFPTVGLLMALLLVPQLFLPCGADAAAVRAGVDERSAPLLDVEEASESSDASECKGGFPNGFLSMWLLSCTGWFVVCILGFGTTSAWAEHDGAEPGSREFDRGVKVASAFLILSSVVSTIVGTMLPDIVRFCGGHFNALLASLAILAVAMLSFAPQCPSCLMAMCNLLLLPPASQVVFNVAYDWLEARADFNSDERGKLTGWFNSALAVGQCFSAFATGPVVALSGGRVFASFLMGAFISFVVVMLVVSSKFLAMFCGEEEAFASKRRFRSISDLARPLCAAKA